MIWYKTLLFGTSRPICSYLIGSFQNFVEEILTDILLFFRYRSWFEAFLYLLIEDGGGSLWKDSIYTLQLLFEAPLTA